MYNSKYDKYIIDLFVMPGSNRIRYRLHLALQSNKYINIKTYLNNRYSDSLSVNETVNRILYGIENRPVCSICGAPVKYIRKPNSKGLFAKYCSASCKSKGTQNLSYADTEKSKQTKLLRYGTIGYNNSTKGVETKHKKYGNGNNFNKIKQTKLERYDNAYFSNVDKIIQTKLDKYGYVYVNSDKAKQTKKLLYKSETYNNRASAEQTNIERYGTIRH